MKENTKKTLGYYLRALAKYKASLSLTVLAVIGASLIDAIIPLYFKKFFDLLTQKPAALAADALIAILMAIAGLNLLQWLAWRASAFLANYFQSKAIADLSEECFAYMHRHSFSFFNNNFVGSLTKKVKWFTGAFEDILDRVLWEILPLIIGVAVIVGVLAAKNIFLGLGMLVWIMIFLGINWFFTRYKLKYDFKKSEAETETTGILADTITNNGNVKIFNGYDYECRNFAAAAGKLQKLRQFVWNLHAGFDSVQGFLVIVLETAIFYVAIKFWQKGVFTVGDFALIQAYLIALINRIWSFGNMIRRMYEKLADAEEMTVILEAEQEIKDILGAKNLRVKAGGIVYEKVDFNYHQTRRILRELALTVAPGERLAIIGSSGSGKTTVVKLLLRMHDLTSGRILIDGQDISQVTQESLWRQVSIVPQDPILFHRTLRENIRYGRAKATDKEVVAAAKAAHCHEFIKSLPEGYDTFVGERGIKLSGGERQRVAIARAILRNAPILVLDEATSSLDSESESLIQDALDKLMKGKTVIVIAHRLSTIRKMDRIVVMDQGQIVEQGTHQELSARENSIYRKLWHLQASGFIK